MGREMDVKQAAGQLLANVQKVIVGKADVIELALVAMLCEGHVLIEDVPGIGKTTMARALAASLGCSFRRIQFTPDLLPSDVTGISFFNQKQQEFEFRAGPVMAQVVLADEINRATPRTQSALLEAMQERQITVDGETHALPRPFLVLATQNPIELEGTFPLPEAQVDRFLVRIRLGYPSEQEENDLLVRFERGDPLPGGAAGGPLPGGAAGGPLPDLAPVTTPEAILAAQAAVREIEVEPSVREYLVRVVRATRSHGAVELGASPRGALALYRACQALAAVRGRDFVLPDDVKELTPAVLTHRILISPQTRLRGRHPEEVLQEIVDTVPVPVSK